MTREQKLAIAAIELNEIGRFICFNHGKARKALELLRHELAECIHELEAKGFVIPENQQP